MHDANKIIPGLVVFVLIATFPIWNNLTFGEGDFQLELEKPAGAEKCVMDTQTMRLSHMDLLDKWRDSVVRDGERIYVAEDGTKYNMSLTHTCLGCHTSKENFCDRCHNAAAVDPYCWECHIIPEAPATASP